MKKVAQYLTAGERRAEMCSLGL